MNHLSEAVLKDTIGISCILCDVHLIHLLRPKIDFVVVDAAMRNWPPCFLTSFIEAAGPVPVLVRVEETTPAILQRYLNAGADGLILTGIHHAAEAEQIIASCLYPPEGVRAFTGAPLRMGEDETDISLQALNDQLTLIIEVAHPQTIAEIEEIAEVTGVNGLLLSPRKLAVAMERGFNIGHADVRRAIQSVTTVARSFELPLGWEGDLPAGMRVDFHLACSDRDIFRHGLERVFPAAEDAASGLRALR